MQGDEIKAAQSAFSLPDPRELNPLQMAYLGDTLHDLYVRSMLVSRKMSVGAMHKQAVRMVSAAAQARMLEAIEPELTEPGSRYHPPRTQRAGETRRAPSTRIRRITHMRPDWKPSGVICM